VIEKSAQHKLSGWLKAPVTRALGNCRGISAMKKKSAASSLLLVKESVSLGEVVARLYGPLDI